MKIGDRVTEQPARFYDGRPVPRWPDPQFVGTVSRFENVYGVVYAVVKYETRKRPILTHQDRLTVIA